MTNFALKRAVPRPSGLAARYRQAVSSGGSWAYLLAVALSAGCGAAVATAEPPFLYLLVAAMLIAVAVAIASSGGWLGQSPAQPATTVLVGLGVIAVTWNGLRGTGGVAPFDVLFGVALLGLGLAFLRGGGVVPLPGWLLLAAASFVGAALITELFVPDPPREVVGTLAQRYLTQVGSSPEDESDLVGLIRLELAVVAVPVLIGAVASSWRRAQLIADLWLLSAVVSAGVASLDLLAGTGIAELTTGLPPLEGRETGLASHSNHLALASAMALPVALGRASSPRGLYRALAIAGSAVLVVGILASGSRAGFVAMLAAVGLSALLLGGVRGRLAWGVIALVVAGSLVVLTVGSNFVTFERLANNAGATQSNTEREGQLDRSLSVVKAHGLTGVGFATVRDAHNLYLQIVQAGGIVAVTAFGIFAFGAIRLGWRLSRDSRAPPESTRLAAALTASLCVWLIAGLVQNPVSDRYIYVPFGVLLGLWLTVESATSSSFRERDSG